MLSEEEELRVNLMLGVIQADIDKGEEYASEIKLKGILWVTEKLKEVNEEFKKANSKPLTTEVTAITTIGVGTPDGVKIVATWNKAAGNYDCTFCKEVRYTYDGASAHYRHSHESTVV